MSSLARTVPCAIPIVAVCAAGCGNRGSLATPGHETHESLWRRGAAQAEDAGGDTDVGRAPGSQCPLPGAACVPSAPGTHISGALKAGKTCGDSNDQGGDGCLHGCLWQRSGYDFPIPKDPCVPPHRRGCGDGTLEANEACDDGNRRSGDGCSGDCRTVERGYECREPAHPCVLRCGNGHIDVGEQCDLGVGGNTGGYGGCDPTCTWPEEGRCGDGRRDVSHEACDDSVNSGAYGTCMPNCQTLAPHCGDGLVDRPHEQCDDPAGNDGSYGGCRPDCRLSDRCGDGLLQPLAREGCDDGNTESGDGCSSRCAPEPGFSCPVPGEPCLTHCGNGALEADEPCDDGNRTPDDGCDPTCSAVAAGWICPTPGAPCRAKSCGDGIIAGYEACDDGNTLPGDGCSERCEAEVGYDCITPGPGEPCVETTCGDGIAQGLELCDDGGVCAGSLARCDTASPCPDGSGPCTPKGADGCDAACMIEIGWACPPRGGVCVPTACGDGLIEGAEQCEDDNGPTPLAGDGCDTTCRLEPGFHCPAGPGEPCVTTQCPNGIREGDEPCDDGNRIAGDGCDPACRVETIYDCDPGGHCRPICGDGITLTADHVPPGAAAEACDDGNLQSGDGCSAACTIESGYTCTDFDIEAPSVLHVEVTVRDFRGRDEAGEGDGYYPDGYGHPDFETYDCERQGMVRPELGSDGLPVLDPEKAADCITAVDTFSEWYRDVSGVNRTITQRLTLKQDLQLDPDGSTYVYDSAETEGEVCHRTTLSDGGFYPIDVTEGFGPSRGYDSTDRRTDPRTGLRCRETVGIEAPRNYHFTTHLSAFFRYRGGETLHFSGDDDVWVFINGKLAVDIGGVHGVIDRSVILAAERYPAGCDAARGTPEQEDDCVGVWDPAFNIYEGGIYAIDFFHAERHKWGSNFKLTLTGFLNAGTAFCTGRCGDGILVRGEACDDGNTDGGDGCTDACEIEPGYSCDGEPSVCVEPTCNDGRIDWPETCEDGNTTPGDGCNDRCQLELCGNGILDAGELCDDGNEDNHDACPDGIGGTCQGAVCGDHHVYDTDGGTEQCDDGNTEPSDFCTYPECRHARCGDGIVSPAEVCDDGVNSGAYGSCSWDCLERMPTCGDGIINGNELCDGRDTGTADCESEGFGRGGTLVCNAHCDGYDASGCTQCCHCSDCNNQACIDGQCGACVTTDDCCFPLLCLFGRCTLH